MRDQDAIRQQIARFIDAYNVSDLAGVMHCYSADLVKIRQGATTETHAQTRERLGEGMRQFAGRLTVVNDEVVVAGDMAYTRGTLHLELTPRSGGAPQTVDRRFLEIWRRKGDQWRVTRTMDNSV